MNYAIVIGPLGTQVKFEEIEPNVFVVRASRVAKLKVALAKLNRKGSKIGGGIGLEIQTYQCQVRRWDWSLARYEASGEIVDVATVRLTGDVPRVNGWAFVAKVEHHGEVGNIISHAPRFEDVELPVSLRSAVATCDHCNTARYRKDTFVLQNEAGELKRVGRNCLADFLRTADISGALGIWRLLYSMRTMLLGDDDDDGFCDGFGRPDGISVLRYLACSCSAIRRYGWVSTVTARDREGVTSSRAHASFLAHPVRAEYKDDVRREWHEGQPCEADLSESEAIIEWAEELGERTELSEYLSNLRVAIALGRVEGKQEGLVTSAVVAYRKEKELEIERAKRDQRPPSQHFGDVKKRYTFNSLEVELIRYIEGDWGVRTLVVLVDAEGRRFKWWASGEREFKKGQIVTGKGTVKAHEEYQGRLETVLSRCDFSPVEASAA